MRSLLNILFPPHCRLCEEATDALLCPSCIDLLAPPDPDSRCRHCFVALDSAQRVCPRCSLRPILSAPTAFLFDASPLSDQLLSALTGSREEALLQIVVSLAVVLWSRLDWPPLDLIVPIPSLERGSIVHTFTVELSRVLSSPFSCQFSREWRAPFRWRLKRRKEGGVKGRNLLLFSVTGTTQWLRNAVNELQLAQPKSIRILSIFEPSHTL